MSSKKNLGVEERRRWGEVGEREKEKGRLFMEYSVFSFLIVAKALDGQRYPLPLCEHMLMCDGERGSGPEGADDLCLVSFEALGLNLSINNGI